MYEVGSHKAETAVTWDFLNMTYCNALGCLNTHKGKTARKRSSQTHGGSCFTVHSAPIAMSVIATQ